MQRVFSDKLYSNATYLMLTTIVTSGLGFFFWVIVARFYTVEDVGLATTIISSMMLIATLSVLGFDIGLIRFLPQADLEKSKRMINSCLSISGILSISLVVIFLLGLDFLSPKLLFIRESASFISLFALFTFIWSLSMLVDGIFISQRTAKYVFARSAIFSILKLSVPILVVTLGAFGIFFSWGISALVAFLIAIFYLLPKIILGYRPRFSVNKKIIDHMIHFSFGNYVANLLGNLPLLVLPLMITNFLFPNITAYFYISWMISNLLFMIPIAISYSLLAEVSNDEGKFEENLRKAIKFAYLLVIPGIILLFILGDKLLLLFGEEYAENAFSALRIFAISGVFYTVNVIYITIKNIQKRVGTVITVNALIAFFTLSLSYLLLDRIGLEGIAIAWLLSQISVIVMIFWNISLRKYMKQDSSN